jgi:hypothetical protein
VADLPPLDAWFPGELHHLLVVASERGVPLPVLVDVLISVIATAAYGTPAHERAAILMRLAMALSLDLEISVEPKPPHRPC